MDIDTGITVVRSVYLHTMFDTPTPLDDNFIAPSTMLWGPIFKKS